jgi:hypothetical protein
MKRNFFILFLSVLIITSLTGASLANTDELKVYRKVYPDVKPGCVYCHVDKIPKKDDGQHDLNAYGQKLKELMGEGDLTEEIIESVGSADEFENK